MPAATVVDQLIVKLGLDPRDFDKGQKAAAAGILRTEKEVKRSTGEMSKSVVAFTGKLLGIATAAAAVKKVIGGVSDLSVSIRQLGIDSRNFGIAASEMRNFQNVGELFGGKAEGVTQSIAGITKAVYDLAYNGQISDSLVMLGRLGVRFQDTAGNARSFRDITLDTEKAVQRLMKSGSLTRENANQLLQQAGFDPGLTQAILSGTMGSQLARQEGRRQVTSGDIDLFTKWEQSATSRDQEVAATAAGLPTTTAQAKIGIAGNEGIEAIAHAGKDVATFTEALDTAAEKIKIGANKIADAFENILPNLYPKGREGYESTIQKAAAKYGVDPEYLAGVLNTESKFNPTAVNPKSGAAGIAQLMPKYFPNAGKNPHEDINTAAEYLRKLHDSFVKSGEADDSGAWYLALQSYNAGQTRVRRSMAEGGTPLAQETLDYPGKVLGYAAGAVPTPGGGSGGASTSTSSNEVNIGAVNINTQATDADGIARDFAGATKRKLQAAQADVGMK